MTDVLGFNCVMFNDGRRIYGCRGMGPRYQEFYEWLHKTDFKDDSSDWPWHYFTFPNLKTEVAFLNRYAADMLWMHEEED